PVETLVRHAVDDTYGEVVLRGVVCDLVEDGLHHRGRELLGRQAVAAGGDTQRRLQRRRTFRGGFGQGGHHVEVQRIAGRARLLRAVEHGEAASRAGQGGQKRRPVEWTTQPHLQHAD